MRDFQGLDENDDSRSNYRDFNNEMSIRNLREDLREQDGSIERQLKNMRSYSTLQQQEIKNNYDSLIQLQLDMEKKNRARKNDSNDFYNTLAAENKTILANLRSTRRNTVGYRPDLQRTHAQTAYMTPYEQRYGFNNSSNYNPSMHHESVFLAHNNTQVNNHQRDNEALDDLLRAYQSPAMNNSYGYSNGGSRFELPVPKSSMNYQNAEENAGMGHFGDQDINVEDSLDKFVDDADNLQRESEQVA